MKEDRIISALLGLIGACNNNPKTENTDRVVMRALAAPCLGRELSEGRIDEIVEEIYAEKAAVAPDCASCAMPCGNTSDYDMNRIYEAEEEIREIKLALISKAEELAACVYEQSAGLDPGLFYRVLSSVSYDAEKERLLGVMRELEEAKSRLGSGM